MKTLRQLVVNADDFGFTQDVNAGIVQGHRNGILTATTLMANGDAFEDAVRLARENPSLDVGCHLVLIGGHSLLPPHRPLPKGLPSLLRAMALGQIRLYEELEAQVRRILAAGIQPTHLDTHKHTHLLPPVLKVVARLSQAFRIPWIRRPFDIPLGALADDLPWSRRAAGEGMHLAQFHFRRILRSYGCRSTDHFAGFQITGRLQTRDLVRLLRHLPNGTTEFMCHPGLNGAELQNARTRLKESRQRELEALTAPETRRAVEESQIRLVSYRDL